MNNLSVYQLNKTLSADFCLKDISFTLPAGQITAILGHSGSGKSTLLQCLNQLIIPDRGIITIQGTVFHFSKPHSHQTQAQIQTLRTQIGLVFQQFYLWPHLSVWENITLAPRHVRKRPLVTLQQEAKHWLQQFGLEAKAYDFPADLSGGEQQRVAIIRALLMQPSILLLDEPTASLDPKVTAELGQHLRKLADAGLCIGLTTHETGFAAQVADQVLFMEKGRLIEACTVQQQNILAKEPAFQQFLSYCHTV